MHQQEQQILILADLPDSFCLKDLVVISEQDSFFVFNMQKFPDHEFVEIIVGGLTFTLSLHQPDGVQNQFLGKSAEHVFCSPHQALSPAIGISLGNNITSGKHLNAVNKAILQLAAKIGVYVNAHTVIWCPANLHVEFDFFAGSIAQYIEAGAFPVLSQIAIITLENGNIETRGLSYFSHPEIRMQVSTGFTRENAMTKLMRLIDKATSNVNLSSNTPVQEKSGDHMFFMPVEGQAALGAASRTF